MQCQYFVGKTDDFKILANVNYFLLEFIELKIFFQDYTRKRRAEVPIIIR